MTNPFTLISAKWRKLVYTIFAFVALALVLVHLGITTAGAEQPTWLKVAEAVVAYLTPLIGALAASNTPADKAEILDAVVDQVGQDGVVDIRGRHEAPEAIEKRVVKHLDDRRPPTG